MILSEREEDAIRHAAGHPGEVHPPELSCIICCEEIRSQQCPACGHSIPLCTCQRMEG